MVRRLRRIGAMTARRRLAAATALSVVLLVAAAQPARADDASPAPTTPGVARNDDIVRLKSGALFRGTISQLLPDDRVEILLTTGETKWFSMSDVDYAGALVSLPPRTTSQPTPVEITPPTRSIRFDAVGDAATLTLGVVTGDVVGGRGPAFTYRRLCAAPCAPDLSPGSHRLLLWGAGSRPRPIRCPCRPGRAPCESM